MEFYEPLMVEHPKWVPVSHIGIGNENGIIDSDFGIKFFIPISSLVHTLELASFQFLMLGLMSVSELNAIKFQIYP